jgi:hypothetical protein
MRAFLAGIMLLGLTAASASACGFGTKAARPAVPAVGTEIARKLKSEQIAPDIAAKVKALTTTMASLLADHKIDEARAVEEHAMQLLGYHKAYLRCGPGVAVWMKAPA